MSDNKLGWGIIGAGSIAHAFAKGLATSATGRLVAVGSRDQEKANKFAKEYGAAKAYGNYAAVLSDPAVQAVYVCTPHPMHAEWTIKAAEAKKHILCEKPIGMNFAEASAMVEAARENDVFLMEAFMYRCHPQIAKLVELLREKSIGDVRMMQATLGFDAQFIAQSRLWANELGGGGILDVGCYPVSFARLVAGAISGKDFADPVEVRGLAQLNPQTHVDACAGAVLRFASGLIAQLSCSIGVNQDNVVRIYGSAGTIYLPSPWGMAREANSAKIIIYRWGKESQEITVNASSGSYGLEADVVAAHLKARQAPAPAMSWEDTLGNMRTLDQWRQSVGLVYAAEKFETIPVLRGGKLQPRAKNTMTYGRLAHLDKPVSRLILGVDAVLAPTQWAGLWDDFVERGGNTFDTAHIYGGGQPEMALGQWIKARGIRSQVNILSKGAHTPDCNPQGLKYQHHDSLRRLGVEQVDIYLMHRDNPQVPVGEFVDALNEHVKAGTMKAFGGSNWSLERLDAANEWAKKNNKQGFSAVSNNFSLARMVDPVWPGCLLSSDPKSRAWFKDRQFPLMAWSSQARGFFVVGRAAPDKKEDEELVRCWYAPDNFQRLQRAQELAAKRGVLPINIALAYVLNQPFPSFALIGPRQLSELRSSLPALGVQLTPEEVKWLNLGE